MSTTPAADAGAAAPAEKVVLRFKAGDKMRAQWKGKGKWYDATIEKVNDDNTYDVLYSDGDKASLPEGRNIRTLAQGIDKFIAGDKCIAQWKGKGRFYPATIKAINADGTFDLVYDDGDKDKAVPAQNCKGEHEGGHGYFSRPQKPLMKPEELEAMWKKEREMPAEERRKRYKCGPKFTEAKTIKMWNQYGKVIPPKETKIAVRDDINGKVALWRGNICAIEIDAIVNAANERCLGGGGIDGAIHSAAGDNLYEECRTLNGCPTGQTKLTRGHKLPADYILHTVGPMGEDKDALESCYWTTMELCKKHAFLRRVALCGVSTGIFGYPLQKAAQVALSTVRKWMETGTNASHVDQVIFVNFKSEEEQVYENLTPYFFPIAGGDMADPGDRKKVRPYIPPKKSPRRWGF